MASQTVTQKIQFKFVSAYQGESDYMVYGDGLDYRVHLRTSAPDYMRETCSAKGAAFDREYTQAIGILRSDKWFDDSQVRQGEVSGAVLKAFNAWQIAEYLRNCAEIRKYWAQTAYDCSFVEYAAPPAAAVAGYYDETKGWVRSEVLAEAL